MVAAISGLAVTRQDYPAGQAGVDLTINKVVTYILEGRHNQLARQFAEGILRAQGVDVNSPLTNAQAMQAMVNYVRSSIRYRPDAHMTETVQNPVITLCVPGAAACIPVGDCDDGTAVLGWLATAYGIPVRLLIQHFNSNTDHVLLEIQNDDGQWLACDFSNFNSENRPVGWKPQAASEYHIDPFDSDNLKMAGARDVEFVAVGRVPQTYAFVGGVPKVTLGRLPPRRVGAAADYAQSTTDLANQVSAVIAAGDTYMNATPPEYDAAISSYKAAGQAGASSLGPEIDRAGQAAFTSPLTQKAWTLNGELALTTGATVEAARSAQSLAKQMEALYAKAITVGSNPPAKATFGTGVNPIAAIVVVGVGGGLIYAAYEIWKGKRRR